MEISWKDLMLLNDILTLGNNTFLSFIVSFSLFLFFFNWAQGSPSLLLYFLKLLHVKKKEDEK